MDATQHTLRAGRLRHAAVIAVIAACVPPVFAPAVTAAWFAVAAGLVAATAAVAVLLAGRPRRARTATALAALAFIVAQVLHSPLVLTDVPLLISRALLLVGVPLPLLTTAFVLATLAVDAERMAWGRRYQQRVGYQPSMQLRPTHDWAA
jgi:ABC-type xylose transport system permease subunit